MLKINLSYLWTVLLIVCIFKTSFSQKNEVLNVVYELDYRYTKEDESRIKTYYNLVVGNETSAFDNQSNFKRDSLIQNKRDITIAEIKGLYVANFYFTVIKKKG